MKLHELRQEPHLSASGINDYMECGLAYRFARIDRLKAEFTADALVFGTCIHQVLADFHQERLTGYYLSKKKLESLFAQYWEERAFNNSTIRYKAGNSYDSLLEQGKNLVREYFDNYLAEELTVLAIEEPFRFTVEGLPVPIIGAMDLVEEDEKGTIIITDFKTATRAYSDDDVRKNFQLMVYHLAARSNGFRDRNIVLMIECLVKTKNPQLRRYSTSKDEWDETRAVKKIREVWNGIESGVFIPNDASWKCKDCCYKSACQEWFCC